MLYILLFVLGMVVGAIAITIFFISNKCGVIDAKKDDFDGQHYLFLYADKPVSEIIKRKIVLFNVRTHK